MRPGLRPAECDEKEHKMSVWKQTAKSRGENGGDYELPPEGNQAARCVALVDIGTQRSEYQGKASWRRRLVLVWELADAAGKPLVCKDFTMSLHENAALRAWVDSWRGKPLHDGEDFDLASLLGRACYVTISHKTTKGGKGVYAVDGVTAPPRVKGKEVEVEEPSRQPVLWWVEVAR